MEKQLTGYPSIDQPWTQYYNKESWGKTLPKRTVYQEIYENNKNYVNDLALEYFGARINYSTLFKKIDETAKSLEEYGIKRGDFVTVCVAGIPETVYTFYALSKIGAIANMISPFFDKDELVNRIEDCESKTIIIMDKFYPHMSESIKKSSVKEIIIIPTLNSSILGLLSKKIKTGKNEYLWNQFIKDGKHRVIPESIKYEKDLPLAMVYSSGTTGAAKGILLSNDSFQNSIQAYPASGVDISRGQKFYQIIPPWFSTGLSTSIHLPLSYGTSVFMDPRFERDVFVKNVLKVKPNYAVAPTSMYEAFLNEKLIGKKDLSFFNYPFEGGEPLRKEVKDKIESVFKSHGSDAVLRTAYGQCECGAAITTQTQKIMTGEGSVGIPLPGVNVKIVDENYNELPVYSRGQIIVDTPCGMIEYYKNPEATKEYFRIDENGVRWSCTQDIGYFDKDGNLYVLGRASDFSVVNNKKIYNFDIENIILQDPDIKMCDVLPRKTQDGDQLTVHLVFDDGYCTENEDQFIDKCKKLQKDIYAAFGDMDIVPFIFKKRKDFPYAKSGKRDTKQLLNEVDGFIEIEKFKDVKIKKLC
jgi:long-chain acyl-CoA synthetase